MRLSVIQMDMRLGESAYNFAHAESSGRLIFTLHFARAWRMARNSSAATKPVSAPANTDTTSRNGR